MADTKISALGAAAPLSGAEQLVLVQSGDNKQIELDDLVAYVAAQVPAHITTYASLQEVIDAGLADGTVWRIGWTGGELYGTILNGSPSWAGWLPYAYWGTTISTISTANGGALGSDTSGVPRLTVTSAAGSSVFVDLGVTLDRPERVRLLCRLSAPSPADDTSDLGGLTLRRQADGIEIRSYLGRATAVSGWYAGASAAGATIAYPNLDTPSNTSKFNPAKEVEFEILFLGGNILTSPQIAGSCLPAGETRKVQGPLASSAAGSAATTNLFSVRAQLTGRGAATTLDVLALQVGGPAVRG